VLLLDKGSPSPEPDDAEAPHDNQTS
jgi:hypothetical protein